MISRSVQIRPVSRRLGALVAAAVLLVPSRPRTETVQDGAVQRFARGDFSVVESLPLDGLDAIGREVKKSDVSSKRKAAFLLEVFESVQRRLHFANGTAIQES